MNKTLRNKWIKALKSGKYSQGQSYLYHMGNYCCLGVLCEVSKIPSTESQVDTRFYRGNGTNDVDLLDKLLNTFGLTEFDQDHLISMNDTHRNSFDEIANWIEENL